MDPTPTATFDILPVEPADIPRLAHIHVITCMSDNAFRLYFSTPSEFTTRVTEMLEGQIGDPTWHHVKAVDQTTGEIGAWASWNIPNDEQIRDRDAKVKIEGEEKAVAGEEKEKVKGKGEFDFPAGLAMHVKIDTEKWLNEWTCNRRHILLKGLFTEPVFQRRGMGSALVRYGNTHLGDRGAGLPIFLQASAYGWSVYAKYGFKTVQVLDVDLRDWIPGGREKGGDGKGYGGYRFRYMVRLPETLGRAVEGS